MERIFDLIANDEMINRISREAGRGSRKRGEIKKAPCNRGECGCELTLRGSEE